MRSRERRLARWLSESTWAGFYHIWMISDITDCNAEFGPVKSLGERRVGVGPAVLALHCQFFCVCIVPTSIQFIKFAFHLTNTLSIYEAGLLTRGKFRVSWWSSSGCCSGGNRIIQIGSAITVTDAGASESPINYNMAPHNRLECLPP